jgi:hypothetical protein
VIQFIDYLYIQLVATSNFFFILVFEAIGTAATPGPIAQASSDSEDDCEEADEM